MFCACGCGKRIPFDRLNESGELETLRPDCILEGLGNPFSIEEYMWRVWNEESLIKDSSAKERLQWLIEEEANLIESQ